MTVLAALLGRRGLSFASVAVDLSLLGSSAAFSSCPLPALLQHRPDRKAKGVCWRG